MDPQQIEILQEFYGITEEAGIVGKEDLFGEKMKEAEFQAAFAFQKEREGINGRRI